MISAIRSTILEENHVTAYECVFAVLMIIDSSLLTDVPGSIDTKCLRHVYIAVFNTLATVYSSNLQLVPQGVTALDEEGPDDTDASKENHRAAIGY
jgi:hypothetical protein